MPSDHKAAWRMYCVAQALLPSQEALKEGRVEDSRRLSIKTEVTSIKTEVTSIKTEVTRIKTEVTSIKTEVTRHVLALIPLQLQHTFNRSPWSTTHPPRNTSGNQFDTVVKTPLRS